MVDTRSEILCIPAKFIKEWQRRYDPWNEFVISTFQGRYNQLLNLFSSVAFNNIETRIAGFLNSHASRQKTRTIPVTHLALANALGTTRVVVSRILKRFEQEGKIRLLRNNIEIVSL